MSQSPAKKLSPKKVHRKRSRRQIENTGGDGEVPMVEAGDGGDERPEVAAAEDPKPEVKLTESKADPHAKLKATPRTQTRAVSKTNKTEEPKKDSPQVDPDLEALKEPSKH